MHAKTTLLLHNGDPWCKSNSPDQFDVTMGSYDGAETCELVGSYLLSKLSPLCQGHVGLYRDDGIVLSKKTARQVENLKKKICEIFRKEGLRVTISANQKEIDFLDVTFNLNSKSYRPYLKPGSSLKYVHKQSNHPPTILKNIPLAINHRLSSISSNEQLFNQSKEPFQAALNHSKYDFQLSYPSINRRNTTRSNRSRQIIWFNPPFCKSVKTRVGHKFLQILDKCFHINNPLRQIFNRNTVKISFSCLPNMRQIIQAQNQKILSTQPETSQQTRTCNCRVPQDCPLAGQCLTEGVVYQAIVQRQDNGHCESYVGLTENQFKTRLNGHRSTFNNPDDWKTTALSKYIWTLRNSNIQYNVKWSILKKCKPYSNLSKRCQLCLYEKFIIVCKPQLSTLNKRTEIMNTCRHKAKYKLGKYKV